MLIQCLYKKVKPLHAFDFRKKAVVHIVANKPRRRSVSELLRARKALLLSMNNPNAPSLTNIVVTLSFGEAITVHHA